ncbi:MAG: hypothetical protein KJ961_10290, partial [Alphaproteobacteria bacterium]|nr:hypothetical protein [Alphaproteobacteria bacterium]
SFDFAQDERLPICQPGLTSPPSSQGRIYPANPLRPRPGQPITRSSFALSTDEIYEALKLLEP